MIPQSLYLALFITSIFLFYKLMDIPNKYANIILSSILSFLVGFAWVYSATAEFKLHLWGTEPTFLSSFVIVSIVGSIIGFIILVLTWKEPLYMPEKETKPIDYTRETLIGQTGKILLELQSGYIGELDDENQTQVLIYFDNNEIVDVNDRFKIVEIKDYRIIGSLI